MTLQDSKVVRFLSKLPKAESLAEPLVVYLQQPESFKNFHQVPDILAETKFIEEIRLALAGNMGVVVKGWYPDVKVDFSVQGFKRAGRDVAQMVQFQGE